MCAMIPGSIPISMAIIPVGIMAIIQASILAQVNQDGVVEEAQRHSPTIALQCMLRRVVELVMRQGAMQCMQRVRRVRVMVQHAV